MEERPKKDDVVLVKNYEEPNLEGCLAVVREVYQWGVEADIPVPVRKQKLTRSVSLFWDEMKKVGSISGL